MTNRTISERELTNFKNHLYSQEKSPLTIEKYLRDVRAFSEHLRDRALSKEVAVQWKLSLEEKRYSPRSINSMIASLNSFLQFVGACECMLKAIRIQKAIYMPEEKELTKIEYKRLLASAKSNTRLSLIMRTICATGIRVSELKYFTVEAVREREVTVKCKSKNRKIIIPQELSRLLQVYAKKQGIESGTIFRTRSGQALDRSYIWAQMKKLCAAARVSAAKVFPHNLRKLFARSFYEMDKDIAKLADVLGHSSIETTRIYIMATGVEHRRQIETLGLVFADNFA